MKKLLIVLLLTSLLLTLSTTTLAQNTDFNPNEINTHSVITNPAELKKIVVNEDLDVPEGYKLVKVTTYSTSQSTPSFIENKNISSVKFFWGTNWSIRNKQCLGDYYFPNNELQSDWFDGPCDIEETYSESVSATFSTNAGISASSISAGIGFSVTDSTTKQKTFRTSVSAGKKLNVKVYGNYKKYTFDVYKNDKKDGTGTAYKPIGLYFRQFTYSR
ncbi:hypothetical protein PV797_07535 [Clostridiaceae bacterium M8S5]|nr:hypothetical protein PV797_07535 [Clostridiaceae bacterium M8S5]